MGRMRVSKCSQSSYTISKCPAPGIDIHIDDSITLEHSIMYAWGTHWSRIPDTKVSGTEAGQV